MKESVGKNVCNTIHFATDFFAMCAYSKWKIYATIQIIMRNWRIMP